MEPVGEWRCRGIGKLRLRGEWHADMPVPHFLDQQMSSFPFISDFPLKPSLFFKFLLSMNNWTDRQTDRQTGRQAGRRAGGQTDRRTDGQTDGKQFDFRNSGNKILVSKFRAHCD